MTLIERIAMWFYGHDAEKDWPIIDDEIKSEYYDAAVALLALLREQGLVQLDSDQSLPECWEGNRPRAKAFRDMLKAGFRRIKEIA